MDQVINDAAVKIKEVLMPVIDNYARTNSALLTMGLAIPVDGEVDWSQGGKHVTRIDFKGGLEAKRLGDSANDTQKVTYGETKYPVVDSIIPIEAKGTTLQDAFDNEGVMNRTARHLQYVVVEDTDKNLIAYETDIGDGSKDYGALAPISCWTSPKPR
jgi:hypothetical protein